jgi:DNA-binding transcriptional LysR family regulator
MHLKALRVFCDVVRLKSFSRAADENGVSQSAASQMVHHLEERLTVKLIDRSKRPFLLTAEGKLFYEGAKTIVEKYAALEERVRNLQHEVAGRVRVASIYSIGLHHMNRYIQTFLAQYPKANVRLEYLHPQRVYQSVEREVSDVGLVSYPRSSRTIQATLWRKEPMVFVCAPQHALARQERIELPQLQGLPMVCFDRDLSIRREIDRALHQRGIEFQVAIEFDNIETVKRAIEIGLGAGLLPEPTVKREVEAGTLAAIPLSGCDLVRPIGIIRRRGRELSPAAQRFIEHLQRDAQPVASERSAAAAWDKGPPEAAAPHGERRPAEPATAR